MSNVKPGDLAQIIKAYPPFEWTLGLVVTIYEPCCQTLVNRIVWEFTEPLVHTDGTKSRCAADVCLKKLPDLGEDDAIHTATEEPKPTKKIVPIKVDA